MSSNVPEFQGSNVLEFQGSNGVRWAQTLNPQKPKLLNSFIMKIQKFEDLIIFKDALDLCTEIYKITREGEFSSDTRFVQQIRAAAGSIMDNIAEGYERDGNKELVNFLYYAKGSCGELRSQIIRAHNVGFIDDARYQDLYANCIKESIGISNFIKSIKNTDYKGNKYYQQIQTGEPLVP